MKSMANSAIGPSQVRSRCLRRHGAVAVEMAMTLPLLLLVVFAAVEFGRMNVIRHTVDNAAYEAARRAIVPGSTAADAAATATSIMSACGARDVTVVVHPPVLQLDTPEVQVEVSVPADSNGFLANRLFRGKTLVGISTLRREQL